MMAAGRADVLTAFADFNGPYQGRTVTTPARYLSFYSPDSDLSIHRNLAIWPDGLPLLWIEGSEEGRHPARQRMVRSRIPRSGPLTRYLSVPAEHTMVADAAADIVLAWIKCL